MLMTDLISRVRYLDENPAGFDDRIPYDEAVKGLQIGLETAKGQLAIDLKETLGELQRRQEENKKLTA